MEKNFCVIVVNKFIVGISAEVFQNGQVIGVPDWYLMQEEQPHNKEDKYYDYSIDKRISGNLCVPGIRNQAHPAQD